MALFRYQTLSACNYSEECDGGLFVPRRRAGSSQAVRHMKEADAQKRDALVPQSAALFSGRTETAQLASPIINGSSITFVCASTRGAAALDASSLRARPRKAQDCGGDNIPDATLTAQMIQAWRAGTVDRARNEFHSCRLHIRIDHRTREQ